MMKTSRIRRALAAVVGLALAGSLTAAAGAGAASAADGHLTSTVLLDTNDLVAAGWTAPTSSTPLEPDGLLGQCSVELPYWGHGFRALQRREFEVDADYYRKAVELVIAFRTDRDAADYVDRYNYGVRGACQDVFAKRWDIRSSTPVTLNQHVQHAETWRVRDTIGEPQSLSITLVQVHKRVEVLWVSAPRKENPLRSTDLQQLVQRATDRVEA